MSSLDESRHSTFHDLTIPDCPRCRQPVRVSEVQLQDLPVSRGIQVLALSRVRFRVGDDRGSNRLGRHYRCLLLRPTASGSNSSS